VPQVMRNALDRRGASVAPSWRAVARRAILRSLCIVLATTVAASAGCSVGYREYAASEEVNLGDGIELTVPVGYNAILSKDSSSHTGPRVDMSAGDMAKAATSPANMINVARLTKAQLSWWTGKDSKYRSHESTGVYAAGFSEFSVGGGWMASVTTRNESRPNRGPVVIMLANLTSEGQAPMRVTAFYRERSDMPSVAPDPEVLFQRVRGQIALSLP